jgi:hypothetical protein
MRALLNVRFISTWPESSAGWEGEAPAEPSSTGSAGASPSRSLLKDLRIRHLGLFFLILAPTTIFAQPSKSDAQLLADADAAFERGVQSRTLLLQARKQFSTAADRYLELHQRGVRSPALYLNLGNAATLADRWPEAIWAYHMGLSLDPNDAALREHLAAVRAKVMDLPSGQGRREAETWPAWLHRPTLNELMLVSALSYMLMCGIGTLAYVRHSQPLLLSALALLVVTVLAATGGWYTWTRAEYDCINPLVIVAENTPLYRGNATSYPHHPAVAMLPRGMEVRQRHRRGQWLQVQLTTGEIGWLPIASTLIVEQ